jgi:protein-disulfide isomerase
LYALLNPNDILAGIIVGGEMARIEQLQTNRRINKFTLVSMIILPIIAYAIGKQSNTSAQSETRFKPVPKSLIASPDKAKLAMPEVITTLQNMVPGIPFSEDHIIDHERLGLYQFMVQDAIFYLTYDGTALIKGDVFDIAMMHHDPERSNITQQFERALSFKLNESESITLDQQIESTPLNDTGVKDILNRIPESQLITFKADAPASIDTFYVFFDISCPRCKKMLPEIKDLQKMGYTVKLILISRAGSSSAVHKHSAQMVCQANPETELTHYIKRGFSGFSKDCSVNLDINYQVTSKLRVRGTPTIVRASDAKLFEGLHYAKDILE